MSRFKLSIGSLAMVLVLASQAFAAAPTISSISPTGVLAGSPSFTLTVNGANFIAPAVLWNGTPLPLTYMSSTLLRAAVPNTFFTAPGTVQIVVMAAGVRSSGAENQKVTCFQYR